MKNKPRNKTKLAKWEKWFDIIRIELSDLVVSKHTFHEVQKILQENPRLHQHSSFYSYLSKSYVSHVVIGVRRQIKCDKDSISIARLFEEMIETPSEFPRKHFTDKYKGTVAEPFADKDFEKFASPGVGHINPDFINADLARLRDATRRCEDFADKRIAHRDKREPKSLPTFNEVDDCVDLLDELYVKYYLLFHAASMDTLLPVWQYDWKSIFRVAWIEGDKR